MATVYSLVCWGGRTGKTVTMTIASPCVVSLTNHGLRDGTGIVFSTTGALPTGVTAGTTYYTRSTASGTFNLYDTEAHAKDTGSTTGRINTSGSQSGTHTAKSKKMLDYFTQYAGRWGASGSERCYDGLASWNTGRSGASGLDEEVCEIGEEFVDTHTTACNITVPSGKNTITTSLDGVRSAAFHNGVFNSGYRLRSTLVDGNILYLSRLGDEADGIEIYSDTSSYGYRTAVRINTTCKLSNSLLSASSSANPVSGAYLLGAKATIVNCVVCNFDVGIAHDSYVANGVVDNCIVVKCATIGITHGVASTTTGRSQYVRNTIALGNTTNWKTGTTVFASATNNLGLTGEAWNDATGTRLETTATAPFSSIFYDYNNNDFRPASAASPQVDTGVGYYGILPSDIADDVRPSYTGEDYGTEVTAGSFVTGLVYVIASVGTTDFTAIGASANTVGVRFKATGAGSGTGTATLQAVVDVGCYEFDHGYGDWPASTTVTFDGVPASTEIRVYDGSANELAGVESSSANPQLTWNLTGAAVRIVIIHLDYGIKEFTYTPVAGAVTLPVQMDNDPWYSNQ